MAGGARRYARAVFELAQEEGSVGSWGERLRTVAAVFADPQVHGLLANRSLSLEIRQEVALAALAGRAGPQGDNLARLLIGGGRMFELESIIDEFDRLQDSAEGRVRATVTSAVDLAAKELDELSTRLARSLQQEVRLTARVDPDIMGGLVVQLGDRLVDASIRSRLQQLRRRLALP
ncbi:MAG TPA: F0F1 ATP synthase subunit delta [Candidatus Acidoferrales bacterium]|nr:F0F1 ATP synthase subunit delta [Candidatus Acidoferrales bacterium]